jgi:hypothetical protein
VKRKTAVNFSHDGNGNPFLLAELAEANKKRL